MGSESLRLNTNRFCTKSPRTTRSLQACCLTWLGRQLTGGVEVWESQEALDRFFQEKLGAALQNANINVQPEVFQIQNMMQA